MVTAAKGQNAMWLITEILILSGIVLLVATVLLTLSVEDFSAPIWFKISYGVIITAGAASVISLICFIVKTRI